MVTPLISAKDFTSMLLKNEFKKSKERRRIKKKRERKKRRNALSSQMYQLGNRMLSIALRIIQPHKLSLTTRICIRGISSGELKRNIDWKERGKRSWRMKLTSAHLLQLLEKIGKA